MAQNNIDLINNLDSQTFYFFMPFGLGDTLMVTTLVSYGKINGIDKFTFIIQDHHEPVLKLLNITNYECVCSDSNIFINMIHKYGLYSPVPLKGKIYVAHPLKNLNESEMLYRIWSGKETFVDWYNAYLKTTTYINPYNYHPVFPKIQDCLKNKIEDFTKTTIENIVMFYPFSTSQTNYPAWFWERMYQKYKTDTNFILSNRFVSDQIPYLNLSLNESLQLCNTVGHIVSNRSGLCDILQFLGRKLTVFYPDHGQTHNIYSINHMVNFKKINEFDVHISSTNYTIEEIV